MHFLTDFADQAVILPLVLVVAGLLAANQWWRGVLAWLGSVGGTLGIIGLGKFLLAACGPIQIGDVLQSPSGHTAAATMVYGGVLGLAWRCLRPGHRASQHYAPLIATLVIAMVIGGTRIALGVHTWVEVIIGGAAGGAGLWTLLALAGPAPARLRPIRLGASVVIVAALLHGAHLRAEPAIQDWGTRLAWLLPGCADQARP